LRIASLLGLGQRVSGQSSGLRSALVFCGGHRDLRQQPGASGAIGQSGLGESTSAQRPNDAIDRRCSDTVHHQTRVGHQFRSTRPIRQFCRFD
jgi:hypothetical protein